MLKPSYYTEPTDVDRMIFGKLVPETHLLRQLDEAIDFEATRALMADCYSVSMGRGAEDPVRMLKLCMLQFFYDLSDDDVIEQAKVNVAFRLFLKLSIESRVPSSGLLSQFRTRLGVERFRAIFNELLGQARARGLVSDRLRLKDATHVLASVAIPTTLVLVAQARDRVVAAAAVFAPDGAAAHRAEAERVRETTRGLKEAQRLVARVGHLGQVVAWGTQVLEGVEVEAGEARQRLEAALEVARKILGDRDEASTGDKMRSLGDPDVRCGRHGIWYDGYMLDVLVDADSEMITAVEVVAANADEAAHTRELIESEEHAQGNDIEAVSIDGAGYRGDVLEQLIDAPDGPGLEVFVPPFERGVMPDRYGPERFDLDEQTGIVTCPAGQQTDRCTPDPNRNGKQYRFSAKQCRGCALREQCLGAGSKTVSRTVYKGAYAKQYERARAVAASDAYREVRRQHPRVERKLNEIVRHHGGRRVRYRGLARARVQYYLVAVVVNLKRMVKLMFNPAVCAEAQ